MDSIKPDQMSKIFASWPDFLKSTEGLLNLLLCCKGLRVVKRGSETLSTLIQWKKKQFLQSGDIVYISNIYISRTQDLLNETQINALLMMHKTMST